MSKFLNLCVCFRYGDKKNPCNRYPEFRNITVRQENLLRDMDQLKAEVACMQVRLRAWDASVLSLVLHRTGCAIGCVCFG